MKILRKKCNFTYLGLAAALAAWYNYMNDMIAELNHLDKMLTDKDGRKETKFHEEVLKNVQGDFGEKESEKIRDMVLMACEMGEERGFTRGFRYAYFLFMECIGEYHQE